MNWKGLIGFLCFGFSLFAHEPTVIEDRDFGIAMEIPSFLNKSWEILHSATGTKVEVFHSCSDEEGLYFLVLGKLSLSELHLEHVDSLYSMIFQQIQSTLGEEPFDDEDLNIFSVASEKELDSGVIVKTHNITIEDDENEIDLFMDVHLMNTESHVFFALAGIYEGADSTLLPSFSEELLGSIHLIEH